MVLFIAPLLYLEAHEIDKSELLKSVKLSLSLAIGLAIATMAAVGFALHAVWPAIPLAAALALGAALGPTDAVAVSSLGKEAALTQRADERAERRIAVQRRIRHRRLPVRHRGGRQRRIRSGRIDHAIRGVLLRWRFLRHRRGHGGRRGVRNDAFPRLGNDDHTYSDGAVPAVHPVFGRGGGARFRHSFGGGRRPAYPLRPHRHRPECGTYEHRLIQRMGGCCHSR